MKLAQSLFVVAVICGNAAGMSTIAAPLCQVRSPAPPMTIIGEQHIDVQMKAIEKEDIEAAKAGKVIFAQEGWVRGHAEDTTYWSTLLGLSTTQSVGVEEERSYSVGLMAVRLLNYHQSLGQLAGAAKTNDFARVAQALREVRIYRAETTDSLNRYTYMKQLVGAFSWPATSLTTANAGDVPFSMEAANQWVGEELSWNKAFDQFVAKVANYLSQDPPVAGYDPRILIEGTSMQANCAQSNRLFGELIIKWRNQYIGRHIAETYCEAAAQGKGVTALIGSLHLKGIHQILNGYLPNNVHVIERNLTELSGPVGCDASSDSDGGGDLLK